MLTSPHPSIHPPAAHATIRNSASKLCTRLAASCCLDHPQPQVKATDTDRKVKMLGVVNAFRAGKLPANECVQAPRVLCGTETETDLSHPAPPPRFAASASRRSTTPSTTRRLTSASSRRTVRPSSRTRAVRLILLVSSTLVTDLDCLTADVIRVLREIVVEKNDDELLQNFL